VAVIADDKRPFSGPTYLLGAVSTSAAKRPISGPLDLLWEVPTREKRCSGRPLKERHESTTKTWHDND
jgi:hypothetical protein